MSDTFDKLKALLVEKKTLTNDEVEKMVADHGDMTDDEKIWLEAERHKLERDANETITMEQYLEATQTLETAEEGSEEYKKAEEIVNKFESGM